MANKDTSKTAQPKRRLGRGLSSLIQNSTNSSNTIVNTTPANTEKNAGTYVETNAATEAGRVAQVEQTGSPRNIPIDQIAANPHQPRRNFNEAELLDLTQSIRQQGILQPLIITKAKKSMALTEPFVLIAGERRLRAARRAKLSAVPCVLREATEQQIIEWAVIENIQRSDLNPIERGEAYRDCMERFNLTQEQVGQRLGQARATIANHLRILWLCKEVKELISIGSLSFGHAKILAGLAGQDSRQVDLARRVVGEGLTVRKLEELTAVGLGQKVSAKSDSNVKKPVQKAAYIRDIEEQLTEIVGTRVTVLPGRAKHRGRIVVDYYSLDDFDRIAGSLGLNSDD